MPESGGWLPSCSFASGRDAEAAESDMPHAPAPLRENGRNEAQVAAGQTFESGRQLKLKSANTQIEHAKLKSSNTQIEHAKLKSSNTQTEHKSETKIQDERRFFRLRQKARSTSLIQSCRNSYCRKMRCSDRGLLHVSSQAGGAGCSGGTLQSLELCSSRSSEASSASATCLAVAVQQFNLILLERI